MMNWKTTAKVEFYNNKYIVCILKDGMYTSLERTCNDLLDVYAYMYNHSVVGFECVTENTAKRMTEDFEELKVRFLKN